MRFELPLTPNLTIGTHLLRSRRSNLASSLTSPSGGVLTPLSETYEIEFFQPPSPSHAIATDGKWPTSHHHRRSPFPPVSGSPPPWMLNHDYSYIGYAEAGEDRDSSSLSSSSSPPSSPSSRDFTSSSISVLPKATHHSYSRPQPKSKLAHPPPNRYKSLPPIPVPVSVPTIQLESSSTHHIITSASPTTSAEAEACLERIQAAFTPPADQPAFRSLPTFTSSTDKRSRQFALETMHLYVSRPLPAVPGPEERRQQQQQRSLKGRARSISSATSASASSSIVRMRRRPIDPIDPRIGI